MAGKRSRNNSLANNDRHPGIEQLTKRKAIFSHLPEEIVSNLVAPETYPKFAELYKKTAKSGGRLTIEELMVMSNYFNRKYHDRLEAAREELLRRAGGRYDPSRGPDFPLVDTIIWKIHEKYVESKKKHLFVAGKQEDTSNLSEMEVKFPTDTKPNMVDDVLRRYHRGRKLGRYEEGSPEQMTEYVLFMTGALRDNFENNFTTLIDEYFQDLQRYLYIPDGDIACLKGLRHKLMGTMRVIKNTTTKLHEIEENIEATGREADTMIDVPLRYLLWKYKDQKKELYNLFSYCQQRKEHTPEKELYQYLNEAKISLHPAHLRMLEELIFSHRFWKIWWTYRYFDMHKYNYSEGIDPSLQRIANHSDEEQPLEVDCLLKFFRYRVVQMNRSYRQEIGKGKKESLHRRKVFDLLGTEHSGSLKEYGLLPSDVEAYYRIVHNLPVVDSDYLVTFLDAFRLGREHGSRPYAAEYATDVLNKTYNLQMTEDERQQRIDYGCRLRIQKKPLSTSQKIEHRA